MVINLFLSNANIFSLEPIARNFTFKHTEQYVSLCVQEFCQCCKILGLHFSHPLKNRE